MYVPSIQPSRLRKTPRSLHDSAVRELARVRVGNVLNAWGGDRLLLATTLARSNAFLLMSVFTLLRQCDDGHGIPDFGRHDGRALVSDKYKRKRAESRSKSVSVGTSGVGNAKIFLHTS